MIPIGTYAHNPQTGQEIVLTDKGWVEAGSPQMASTMSPTDQQGINQLGDDAQQSAWLAQKASEFKSIQNGQGPNDVTGTGIQFHDVHIPLPVLDKINLNPAASFGAAINPRVGDMESVTNQAWAHMRPTGSGPLRMPEVEGFQQSFPNIENSPQTNTDIAQRLNQDASLAASKLQFIDDFIRANRGSYADANAAWQARQAPAQQSPNPNDMTGYAATPQQDAAMVAAGQLPPNHVRIDPNTGQRFFVGAPQTAQPPSPPPQGMQQPSAPAPQQQSILTWNPQAGTFQ